MAKNSSIIVKIIVIVGLLSIANFSLAHDQGTFWTPGEPIVPCGGNYTDGNGNVVQRPECTQCELLHLTRHVIDFIMIAAAPILATLFFIVAGVYMMLGGANPGMLSQGKSMFKNTFIGILIVMLAWLITNTLIQTLADTSKVGSGGNWFQLSCSDIGLSTAPPGSGNPNPPPPNPPPPLPPTNCGQPVCISNENVSNITATSVTITWTSSVPATSQINYGPTASYGSSTPLDNNLVPSHSITISGLTANTAYNYQAVSTISGYTAQSSDNTFATTSSTASCQNYTGQLCSGGGFSGVCQTSLTCGYLQAGSSCTVNGQSGSYVSGLCPGGSETRCCIPDAGTGSCTNYNGQACGQNGQCQTSSTCSALTAGGSCAVGGQSGTYQSGLCPGGSETVCCVPNVIPPPPSPGCGNPVCISNEKASNITTTSVTITWTTNVPATSQVEYISATFGLQTTPIDNNLATNHSVSITNLRAGITYNSTAISSVSGFTARGTQFSFATISECDRIAGSGLINIALVAANGISNSNKPEFTCTQNWVASEMSSFWVTETNKYKDLLSRFPPINTSNFSLYRSKTVNQNACPNTDVTVNVVRCSENKFIDHAYPGTGRAYIRYNSSVNVLAHEYIHAFATVADEYYYDPPYPPENMFLDRTNCSKNVCPGGLSTCSEGCNLQGPGTGWKRPAPSSIMFDQDLYSNLNLVTQRMMQNCINLGRTCTIYIP